MDKFSTTKVDANNISIIVLSQNHPPTFERASSTFTSSRDPKLIIDRSKGRFAYSYPPPPPSRDTYDGKLLECLVTNSDKGNTNLVEIGQINQPSTNGARNRADLSVSSVTNTSGSRCREGINYFNASRWKRERVHATCLARV